jgi:arginase
VTRVAVFEVPYDLGRPRAPLAELDGAAVLTPSVSEADPAAAVCLAVADAVAGAAADETPLLVLGDCLTALGVLAGLQRGGCHARLVWVDAHGDFNTPQTSESGYVGGMPLAMSVGRGDLALPSLLGLEPLAEADVALVGARDLDAAESVALCSSAVTLAALADLRRVIRGPRPVYLHVDVDVVDPAEVPAFQFAAPGGPSPGALVDILAEAAQGANLAAVSIACTWDERLPASAVARDVVRRSAAVLSRAIDSA